MVSSHAGHLRTEDPGSWHDLVIERGMVALLVFAPLAFGSVHRWAAALVQGTSFLLFLVWIGKTSVQSTIVLRGWQVLLPAALLALLAVIQLVPLPHGLVKAFSPAAAAIYETAWKPGEVRWHPLSIHPDATLQELLNLLAYAAVFTVVVNHWRSREKILALVRVIIALACILVVLAVLQKVFWNGRLYWFYPIDPALQARFSYIWGPYVNRNHFAGYLEMAIPLALGYIVAHATGANRPDARPLVSQAVQLANSRRFPRLIALAIIVALLSGALFSTLSRGALAGFSVSLAVFLILARSRRSLGGYVRPAMLIAVLMALTGFVAAGDRIERRFLEIAEEDRLARTVVWGDLLGMVHDFPILGTGLGTFDRAFSRYQSHYSILVFEHAENDYLEILTDTGILGAVTAMSVATVFFVSAIGRWTRRRGAFANGLGLGGIASCVAIAVHGLTDFNIRVPANALLLSVIAALTLSVLEQRSTPGHETALEREGGTSDSEAKSLTGPVPRRRRRRRP